MSGQGWRLTVAWTAAALLMTAPVVSLAPALSPPADPTTATIKDIMNSRVDPSGDFMFGSVVTISDANGVTRKQPRTDAEWAAVREHLVILRDAKALLSRPGLKAAPADHRAQFPEVELQPEEIDRLLARQHADFVKHAARLEDAANVGLKAVDAKDADALFEAIVGIDHACEACHLNYWYPKDEAARVQARLDGIIP